MYLLYVDIFETGKELLLKQNDNDEDKISSGAEAERKSRERATNS